MAYSQCYKYVRFLVLIIFQIKLSWICEYYFLIQISIFFLQYSRCLSTDVKAINVTVVLSARFLVPHYEPATVCAMECMCEDFSLREQILNRP